MGHEPTPSAPPPPRLEDHRDFLLSYAHKIAPPGTDPEDLLQEASLVAHRKGVAFEYPGQLINWYRNTISLKALEFTRRVNALQDARLPTDAEEAHSEDRKIVELAEQARLLFEAVPTLNTNEASAYLLNLHESRSITELARHFPLTRGTMPKYVSPSTLKRRFRAIRHCIRMHLEGRTSSQRRGSMERLAVLALTEALIFTGEREILRDNPLANSTHRSLAWQLRALELFFPQHQDRLMCCRSYLNDLLRDCGDDTDEPRRDSLHILEALRKGDVPIRDPGDLAWAWYNFLLSETSSGNADPGHWQDLLDYIGLPGVHINRELKMNILRQSSGWKAALSFAESEILSRKGPYSPSLILLVTGYLIRNREPRRALQLVKSLPDEGLLPDYARQKKEAIAFCTRHHNTTNYDDASVPSWAFN